ncbi:MAG: FHA domain-containing protein [Leptodesmis sp.]|uniref:FHA domain-containing protein n=1 Tax=Leptodesmis sp. TaxID=3100501 RepID=UPI003D0E7A5A
MKQLRKQNEVLEQLRKQMNSLAVGRRIASAQQSHVLVVTDDRGRIEISLDQAIYSIGRDPNCDIRLVSQSVLRHHATLVQLLYKDGSFCYRIIDGAPRGKRSANGLLINGQKLQAHDLQHEDVIVFSPNVEAVYYRLKQDVGNPPDEFDIDDDDLAGGIAPVPRP